MKLARTLAILVFGLHAPFSRGGAAEIETRRVLFVGIDGCRPDALDRADAPRLKKLMRDGAYSLRAKTGDVTVSGPGWASALTGVWRDKHRVNDNVIFGNDLHSYPHFFARVRKAKPDSFLASIVHWAPINLQMVRNADVRLIRRTDKEVATEAARVLRENDPDVLFLHFDDVDHAGHTFGFSPTNDRYLAAIAGVDGHIGVVLDAIAARPKRDREDWLVVATTDHGGSETGHGKDIPEHRTIFVLVSGAASTKGEIEPAPSIVDAPATALAHLGIAIDPVWRLDGRPVGLTGRTPP